MKIESRISEILQIVLILSLTLALSSCSRKTKTYGQQISSNKITEIDSILKNPADFDGKIVTVQGNIIRECPTGCWFDIKQDQAVIHIDINPSGFAIPQIVGKEVMVEGTVFIGTSQPTITGTGVEIK